MYVGTGVTTNALHPGIVKTEIGRHMGLESSIMASIFVKPLLSFFLKSPEQGALTTLFVALDPSLEKVSGKYFRCGEINHRIAIHIGYNVVLLIAVTAVRRRWPQRGRMPQ